MNDNQDSIVQERSDRIRNCAEKCNKVKGKIGNLVELSIDGQLTDAEVSVYDFDKTGTAIRIMEFHVRSENPHEQYVTREELRAMFAPLFNKEEEKL